MSARGTSNGNVSGNSYARRARKVWLVETYRADRDACPHDVDLDLSLPHNAGEDPQCWRCGYVYGDSRPEPGLDRDEVGGVPACRCYRCGILLTVETVTADRIIPGCQGGTYRHENIRPACGPCNSKTGGATRRKKK